MKIEELRKQMQDETRPSAPAQREVSSEVKRLARMLYDIWQGPRIKTKPDRIEIPIDGKVFKSEDLPYLPEVAQLMANFAVDLRITGGYPDDPGGENDLRIVLKLDENRAATMMIQAMNGLVK